MGLSCTATYNSGGWLIEGLLTLLRFLRRRALLGIGVGLGAALASALLAGKVRAGASKNQLSTDYYKYALAGPRANLTH